MPRFGIGLGMPKGLQWKTKNSLCQKTVASLLIMWYHQQQHLKARCFRGYQFEVAASRNKT